MSENRILSCRSLGPFLLSIGLSSIGCNRTQVPSPPPKQFKTWQKIKHVVVVIFENTDLEVTLSQPFFSSLTKKGALLSNYSAITHPSQPNYIALVSGSTHGVTGNDNVTLSAKHIGDRLEETGKQWKVYAETYPGNCFLGVASGDYARRHVPFLSFESIQNNPTRCGNIVESSQFQRDIDSVHLPTYSLFIPNNKSNGHNTGIAFADSWAAKTFGSLVEDIASNPSKDTLFIITFDEGNPSQPTASDRNQVYTLLIGAGIRKNTVSQKPYNHYSLLKTIENIIEIPSLGQNDETATLIDDIWEESGS